MRGGLAVAQSGLSGPAAQEHQGLQVSYRYHTNSVLYGNPFMRWGRWTKREGSKEREKEKGKKKRKGKRKEKNKERKGSPIVLSGLRHFYVSC